MPSFARDRPSRCVAGSTAAFALALAVGCNSTRPNVPGTGTGGGVGGIGTGTGGTTGSGGAAGACPTADGTIESVAAIVVPKCATSSCHDAVTNQSGMDLSSPDMIHHNWVGVRGLDQCTNMPTFRVLPGNPDGSFVMTKIRALEPPCARATRMPPPPADMLSACEIETVRAWIATGALPPGTPTDASAADALDDGGDAGADDGGDGPVEGGVDGGNVDPTACTSTKACDSVVEICVEVDPTTTSDNCFTHWQCFTHDFEPDTFAHACPPEIVTFCGCDGVEYQASWSCPGMPYDHIGSCGDGYSCDSGRVRCADAAPTCPAGQAPAVVAGCWGPCVPIEMCRCDQNWQCPQRDLYRCVLLPDFRCEPIPPPADAGADGPGDAAAD
jgi:hypothetical protein